MDALCRVFNDENVVCESLEDFLEHFFPASTLLHQIVRDIGELILCYNKTECQRPKELQKLHLLSWDEFQEFVVFCFLKQDPQHFNECNLKLNPMSVESLLKNTAWKQLYEFVGTEIMKIIFTKCYINVGIGNRSYLCLHKKEFRQFYVKYNKACYEATNYRNFYNSGLIATQNKKTVTSGYKETVALNFRTCMYRTNIFPYWPVNHILSRSNLESKIVSDIIDDILQEDVGIQISSKDVHSIKKKLNSLRNLLTYLVQKHKCMAPYSVVLQNVLHKIVPSSSDLEVSEETGRHPDCKSQNKIFFTKKQFYKNIGYNYNLADEKSEKKRKSDAFVNESCHLEREFGPSSEKNSNLTMKCSEQAMKKMKLDNALDTRECGDHLKKNKISVQVQTKDACSKKVKIISFEENMLICEKRKKKFLKLKPLPPHIVNEFLCTTLKHILHKKVFAIEKNWSEFFNFIKKMLSLGKDCSLLLKEVLSKVDHRCIKWLVEVPVQFRKSVLAKFLKWIWNKIVVCIVAANFYVTEFSHCKNKIVFYEKRVWRSLEDTVFSHLLSDKKIVPISRRQWEKYDTLKTSGKFRILPKVDGARPILITKKTKGDYMLLVSKVFLQQLNVHSGTSIHSMNVNELNSTWRKVVTNWKNMGQPKLYFVGVDIRDAYGSVIQDKLVEIIKSNTRLILGKQKTVVFKKLICVKIKKGQLYWSCVAHFVSLPFVSQCNCVLFDTGEDKEFSVKSILTSIRNTVKCQTIQRGTKKFLICQGIAQGGSPLSYALCDVYYSALDKTHLSIFKNNPNDFLIRNVDDYLYITPDISRAKKFKEVMHQGFPDFGVFINPRKTKCNFDCIETHSLLFCGYSVDCNTLGVRPNFSCYTDVEIQHTITFNSVNNPGRFLEAKMDQLNAVKLNRFTLDLEYNSLLTVYCNVFESSVLMACRFVTIVIKLLETINTEFLGNQIIRSASRVVCIVRKLSSATGGNCIDFNGVLWIVYRAFHIILKKKGNIFYNVLKIVNPLMYRVQVRISVCNYEMLKHATSPKHLPPQLKLILRYI